MTPIIMLSGKAGSGKDTVAGFLAGYGAQPIAMADPMKRLARVLFGFTVDQLWGGSASRNAPDQNYDPLYLNRGASEGLDHTLRSKVHDTLHSLVGDSGLARDSFNSWYKTVCAHAISQGQLTPRFVLQTMGVEFGRNYNEQLWVDAAKRTAFKLLAGGYTYDREQGLILSPDAIGPLFVVITDGRFRNELLAVLAVAGETVKITRYTDESLTAKAGVVGHSSESELMGIPNTFYTHSIDNNGTMEELEVRVNTLFHRINDRISPIL